NLIAQVFARDVIPATDDNCSFYDILQFTDVARPVVRLECREHRWIELRGNVPSIFGRIFADEVLGQRQNVFLSIPQRRQVNGYDIQPVIKVFSKESFVHSLSQVYVRCGNDSDINLAWACLAERCKVTLLNHPEQLGLGLDRYIAYLVQK